MIDLADDGKIVEINSVYSYLFLSVLSYILKVLNFKECLDSGDIKIQEIDIQ